MLKEEIRAFKIRIRICFLSLLFQWRHRPSIFEMRVHVMQNIYLVIVQRQIIPAYWNWNATRVQWWK